MIAGGTPTRTLVMYMVVLGLNAPVGVAIGQIIQQIRDAGRWLASYRLVARLLAAAALWNRIQAYFNNTKWTTLAQE
jgi:hypothetical protein